MATAFTNASFVRPEGIVTDQVMVVEDGLIQSFEPACPEGADIVDCQDAMVVPGFIDLQVNGGGGVLFNDSPSVDAIATIAAAHGARGTTGFLPTLISDDLDVIAAGIAAVDEAIASGVPGVLGIHIEGPFLNPRRKGIHDPAKLRGLDAAGLDVIAGLKRGRTLVTLAPECVRPEDIAELSRRGVVVAAGHTEASHAEMRLAFDNGLSAVTHLFNAMAQIQPREPGTVGAALADPRCWCAIIVDGVHVDPVVLRLAIAAKGRADRFVLVSDAMPIVGSGKTTFELDGRLITSVDGVCRDADGTLAGADLDMARAFRNAQHMLGIDIAAASRMASFNPASMLGIGDRTGSLEPGRQANFLFLKNGGVCGIFYDGVQRLIT